MNAKKINTKCVRVSTSADKTINSMRRVKYITVYCLVLIIFKVKLLNVNNNAD